MTKKEIEKNKRAYIKWVASCNKTNRKPISITMSSGDVILCGTVHVFWEEDGVPTLQTKIGWLKWEKHVIFVDADDPGCIAIIESLPEIKKMYKESCKNVKRGIRDIAAFCKKYKINEREIYK